MNSRLAQRLDRIVMAVGACCDVYYMKNITDKKYFGICVASFLSSISSYFISKIFLKSRIVFHASAHFWVTVLHTTQLFVQRWSNGSCSQKVSKFTMIDRQSIQKVYRPQIIKYFSERCIDSLWFMLLKSF